MEGQLNYANVKIKGLNKGKPKLKADGFICQFYQTKKSLAELDTYNKFIKNVEQLVRRSKEYKAYKDYIFNTVGLNYCMIFPNINATLSDKTAKVTIELHHGPLLTLYDVCCIVTDHFLENDIPVTSLSVMKTVLDEHFENNIQVMPLCDLAHKLFHAQHIYINPKQAWGYLPRFLEKYSDGVSERMEMMMKKNIEIAKEYNSIDKNGILDVYRTRWDGDKSEEENLKEIEIDDVIGEYNKLHKLKIKKSKKNK